LTVTMQNNEQNRYKEETRYEQWLQMDMRRCEIAYYIQKALCLVAGSFTYQRQKGLDQLLDLIEQIAQNPQDQNIFSLIHRQMTPTTNIIIGIVNCILKESAVKGHHPLSPVRISEIKKALIVIEGACLISPYCSSALAAVHGSKVIVKILSEGPHIMIVENNNSNPVLESLSPTFTGNLSLTNSSSVDASWEEIRLIAIDTLEASLHNSITSAVLFCEDSGPDMIMEMLRNKHLSIRLRSKCVELSCLLFQLLFVAEKRKNNETLIKTLDERMSVFLGQKLTEELRELAIKPLKGNESDSLASLQLIESKIYDQFIKRVDQRL
jgi:hypothetical protein